jgi:serine protease Do
MIMKKFVISLFMTAALFTGAAASDRNDGNVNEAVKYAKSLQDAFASVAEKALPAVVTIKTAKKIKQYYYLPERRVSPFGFRIFTPGRIIQQESKPIYSGQASGFIINEDGYIITNCHVVKEQTDFKVILNSGEEYNAGIVGMDPDTDIAVLKINVDKKLPYLKFADPESVKVGHYAIAIGAPYGLGQTVTTGIVSYKGRTAGMNHYENYIQTDASINPGNSGGPLLNLDGEVIGVNDFILSPPNSRGNIGLAFAIAGKLADNIATQLIQSGKADKPWIGIAMNKLPENQLPDQLDNGVMIAGVQQDSPAETAGLQAGDIIYEINGIKVSNPQDIVKLILNQVPGNIINVSYLHNSELKKVNIKIGIRDNYVINGLWRKR